MSHLDVRAVLHGALTSLVLIVPVVLVARLLAGDDDVSDTWTLLFAGYVLATTLVGAVIAGRRKPETPLVHGAFAALVTFVVAQVISSITRSEIPNLVAVVFFALVFMGLGAIGGFIANALTARRRRNAQEGTS